MKDKRKKRLAIILLVILLFIAIAYGSIQLYYTIQGKVYINKEQTNFEDNVKFNKPNVDDPTIIIPNISKDKKSISFSLRQMRNIGEKAVIAYTIKNDSNYDSMLSTPTCTCSDREFNEFFNISHKEDNGVFFTGTTVKQGEISDNIYIMISLKKENKEYVEKNFTITCKLNQTAIREEEK